MGANSLYTRNIYEVGSESSVIGIITLLIDMIGCHIIPSLKGLHLANSRKRAGGFTPCVFPGVFFKVFISFAHYFGIIIKEKYSSFDQGIVQQPIMSINKVIIPMTELSDPPSY